MDAEVRTRKKKPSATLAALLLAAAVLLTIISLLPDRGPRTRGPQSAPTGQPSPTASASPPPRSAGDAKAIGGLPSGGPSSGSSGVVDCALVGGGEIDCPKAFSIVGSAYGLYPGGTVRLPLDITNPNAEDIRVTSIDVSVVATSGGSCSPSNVHAADYAGEGFLVPAGESRTISLALTMSAQAPDACQNVTFTLSYSGEAEQA